MVKFDLKDFWWEEPCCGAFWTALLGALLIGLTAIALAIYQGGSSKDDNIHYGPLPNGVTELQPSLYRISKSGSKESVCSEWADVTYNNDGSITVNCYNDQRWNVPYPKPPDYTPWHEFAEAVWMFWAAWGAVGVLALVNGIYLTRLQKKKVAKYEALQRTKELEKELKIGV